MIDSSKITEAVRRGYMDTESQANFTQHFSHVTIDIEDGIFAINDKLASCVKISTVWQGVDRPITSGLCLDNTPSNKTLAERYAVAIRAGAVFCLVGIRTDSDGNTYVEAIQTVMGRTLNADLKRIGY